MDKKPQRHMPYYTLLDAIRSASACPLCELETAAVNRYLDHLLYENVNDPGLRSRLRRSKGFCLRHARVILSLKEALGAAILYKDQAELFLRFLDGLRPDLQRPRAKKPSAQWNAHQPCPACALEQETSDANADILLKGLAETEMRDAYAECPGLCVRHFLAVFEKARTPDQRHFLLTIQQEKLTDLLRDLDEFCRKHDYRFSHERFGKEKDCCSRAVRLLARPTDPIPS